MFTEEEIAEWKSDPQIQRLLAELQGGRLQQEAMPPALSEKAAEPMQPSSPQPADTTDDPVNESVIKETPYSGNVPVNDETLNPQPALQNKEQVLKLLLSKFTMAELTGFVDLAKDGLTEKEKAQIKTALLERLTPEEFEAIKLVALAELAQQ